MDDYGKRIVSITTIDNPFNPIEDFKHWFAFDVQKGYNTCSLLARLANTSLELNEKDYNYERETAIDSIISLNPILYKKVVNVSN